MACRSHGLAHLDICGSPTEAPNEMDTCVAPLHLGDAGSSMQANGNCDNGMRHCPVCDKLQAPEDLAAHCKAHFEGSEHEVPMGADVRRCRPKVTDDGSHQALPAGGCKNDLVLSSRACPAVIDLTGEQPLTKRSRNKQLGLAPRLEGPGGGLSEVQSLPPCRSTLMDDLAKCLAQQRVNSTAVLAADTWHYQAERSDAGWGCGYRNCQMLLSALLDQEEVAGAFPGWGGGVPGIPSLQAAILEAWARGWDRDGADGLGMQLQDGWGRNKWIGTTEIAALLCASRVRARIVDFVGGAAQVGGQEAEWHSPPIFGALPEAALPGAPGRAAQESHTGVECDACGQCPVLGACFKSSSKEDYDLCYRCHSKAAARRHDPYRRRPRRLVGAEHNAPAVMQWVWAYFTTDLPGHRVEGQREVGDSGGAHCAPPGSPATSGSSAATRVIRSGKPPLYFQHQGHSRTIVGIEVRRDGGALDQHLLILDPIRRTAAIKTALRSNTGWQQMLKCGEGTLNLAEYQILYVDRGLADSSQEIEDSKTIAAVERF